MLFADTGGEMPETYAYLEKYILPAVKERGVKFTVVTKGGRKPETLEERCLRWRQVPSFKYRNCTRDFKVIPIRRYVRSLGLPEPAVCVMGISADEATRMRNDHPPEYTYSYPLVDGGAT